MEIGSEDVFHQFTVQDPLCELETHLISGTQLASVVDKSESQKYYRFNFHYRFCITHFVEQRNVRINLNKTNVNINFNVHTCK